MNTEACHQPLLGQSLGGKACLENPVQEGLYVAAVLYGPAGFLCALLLLQFMKFKKVVPF